MTYQLNYVRRKFVVSFSGIISFDFESACTSKYVRLFHIRIRLLSYTVTIYTVMQSKWKYITLTNKNFTLLGNKNYHVEYIISWR